MVDEVWQWLRAVLHHWQVLMTGGLVMAIVGTVQVYRDKSLSWELHLGMAGVFVVVAFFLAWRAEHRKLEALEARLGAPQLSGHIGTINTGLSGGDAVIIVGGAVVNPFGPPTAVTQWDMTLEFPNSLRVCRAELQMRPSGDLHVPMGDSGETLVLASREHWISTTSAPIPAGASVGGWLIGVFRNLDPEETYDGNAALVVSFIDVVSGTRHYIRQPMPKRGIHIPGRLAK